MSDDPVFDQVDPAGVPNIGAEDDAAQAAWMAQNVREAEAEQPSEPPGFDPYDDSIPVSERLGSQHLYGPEWEAAQEAARAYAPGGPTAPPKRRRRLRGIPLGKRARQRQAKPKKPPLEVVQQLHPQQFGKPVTKLPGQPGRDWRELISSGAEVLGIGATAYGSWLAWHPAGFIVGGLGVVLLGVASGRND